MIKATGLTKTYRTEKGYHCAVDRISFTLGRGERMAVLGRNGAGKSTLIRLLCGVELPDSGSVERSMSVSWPLALEGGFQPALTGNDHVRFIARIYDRSFQEIRDFVEGFAEIGKFMSEPLRTYSSGMRARLAFALSLTIDFDCYVIDEILAVGDQRFQLRCHEELFDKRKDRALLIAGHHAGILRNFCTKALVLHRGRAKVFDDFDLAADIYQEL